MLWPFAVLDEIEQWAAAQPDKPNRSEAILRLVQQALPGAICQQSETPPASLTDVLKAASASAGAARPLAALPPPKRDSGPVGVDVDQTTPEVRWKPRLVEVMRVAEVPQAQSLANPVEEGKFFEMPEDVRAFNEYWKLAELVSRSPLQYEEVLLAYNRYRQDERRRPVLPLTNKDLE